MKFLFDQSADFRLIPHLRELGHDVLAISREHPPGLAMTMSWQSREPRRAYCSSLTAISVS
jgi:hypothetical protein